MNNFWDGFEKQAQEYPTEPGQEWTRAHAKNWLKANPGMSIERDGKTVPVGVNDILANVKKFSKYYKPKDKE